MWWNIRRHQGAARFPTKSCGALGDCCLLARKPSSSRRERVYRMTTKCMKRVCYWPLAALSLAVMSCGDPSTIELGTLEKFESPSEGTSMRSATKRHEMPDE